MNYNFFIKYLTAKTYYHIKLYKQSKSRYRILTLKKSSHRKKIRLEDVVYKDIPTPMCKCEDCKMVRHPVIKGYRLPRVKRYYRKPY